MIDGFITDFGVKLASSEDLPRFGVWEWKEARGKYEVVSCGDDLVEIEREYRDYPVISLAESEEEPVIKIGSKVITDEGEAIVTGFVGDSVRVVPCVAEGVDRFGERLYALSSVKLADEFGRGKVETEEDRKRWIVTFPGYPSMSTEAESKLKAITNVVANMMQSSSTKKIVFGDEWYGEPQIGKLIELVKVRGLDKYVTEGPEGVGELKKPPMEKGLGAAPAGPAGPALSAPPPPAPKMPPAQPPVDPKMVAKEIADRLMGVGEPVGAHKFNISDVINFLSE